MILEVEFRPRAITANVLRVCDVRDLEIGFA